VETIAANDTLFAAAGPVSVRSVSQRNRQVVLFSLVVAGNHTYAITDQLIGVCDSSVQIAAPVAYSSYSGGGGCFPAGTPVTTPTGLTAIDRLEIGDTVVTTTAGATGGTDARVVGTSQTSYEGDMISVVVDGRSVESTGNHPFFVVDGDNLHARPPAADVPPADQALTTGGRWVEARHLQPGDRIASLGEWRAAGGDAAGRVTDITSRPARTTVYNVTVATLHTYTISSQGLLVHNKASAEESVKAGGPPAEMTASVPTLQQFNTEEYNRIFEPGFKRVVDEPLSTLSIDVDTASYSNVRRFLQRGTRPPEDAVRIEELINYFSYEFPDPVGDEPFSVTAELSDCPWNVNTALLQIGLQAERIAFESLPPNNLVFLLDVSGSMSASNKLPLLKHSLLLLVDELRDIDHVSIVVYAGAAGLVLPPTPCTDKELIVAALERLSSGGSTAGGQGIVLAYDVAQRFFDPDGNNRVILGTDGDFNVGPSSQGALERIIEREREGGVYLTVLGFGMGNYKDARMETLADHGNGNYAYIDSIEEARKVLVREVAGTLYTVANDVKIQIEFNPAEVDEYRIIGYENRLLAAEEFADDRKDAGEMGAGHSVTVLYELKLSGDGPAAPRALRYQTTMVDRAAADSGELLFMKFRYKPPGESESREVTAPVPYTMVSDSALSADFVLSSALASFGMLLRNSEHRGEATPSSIVSQIEQALAFDPNGYRRELLGLIKLYEWLPRTR